MQLIQRTSTRRRRTESSFRAGVSLRLTDWEAGNGLDNHEKREGVRAKELEKMPQLCHAK